MVLINDCTLYQYPICSSLFSSIRESILSLTSLSARYVPMMAFLEASVCVSNSCCAVWCGVIGALVLHPFGYC